MFLLQYSNSKIVLLNFFKDDPYFDEEENYHHVEEQEYEMYDQKYYEREMAHNNEYNEKQTQVNKINMRCGLFNYKFIESILATLKTILS